MNTADIFTPRTDAICKDYAGPLCMIGDQQFIPAIFARELELELALAQKELGLLRELVGVRADAPACASDAHHWLKMMELVDRIPVLVKQNRRLTEALEIISNHPSEEAGEWGMHVIKQTAIAALTVDAQYNQKNVL